MIVGESLVRAFASYVIPHSLQTHTNRGLGGAMVGLDEHTCVQIARHASGRRDGCGEGDGSRCWCEMNERNEMMAATDQQGETNTPHRHTTTQAPCTRATIMLECLSAAMEPCACDGPRALADKQTDTTPPPPPTTTTQC